MKESISRIKSIAVTAHHWIFQRSVFCFLMMAMLMKPAYFEQIPWLSSLFQAGLIAVCALCVLLLVCSGGVRWFHSALLAFYAALCICTVLGDGDLTRIIKTAVKAAGVCAFFTLGMEHRPRRFLHGILPVFEILAYANLLLVLLYPQGISGLSGSNGMGVYTFLGHRNGLINLLMPGVLISLLLANSAKKARVLQWLRTTLMLTVLGLTFWYVGSITSVFSYAAFLALLALVLALRQTKISKAIGAWILPLTSLVFFIGIVWLRLHEVLFLNLLTSLNKSETLSFRTLLWDGAMELIRQRPLLGYGVQDEAARLSLGGFSLNSFHNFYLDTLFEGGFLALLCFHTAVILAWIGARKARYSTSYRLCIAALVCFAVMFNFEVFVTDSLLPFVMVLTIWYHTRCLEFKEGAALPHATT